MPTTLSARLLLSLPCLLLPVLLLLSCRACSRSAGSSKCSARSHAATKLATPTGLHSCQRGSRPTSRRFAMALGAVCSGRSVSLLPPA